MADSKARARNIQDNLGEPCSVRKKESAQHIHTHTQTHSDGSMSKGHRSQVKDPPIDRAGMIWATK